MGGRPVRLATRGSALARWQAGWVARSLGGDTQLVVVDTAGDLRQDVALHTIGGQGVFVKEVQAAVLDGRADAAVHSAKDLPSTTTPELRLAAFGPREDPRDALVGSSLSALRYGGRVATGSVRRRAQLSHLRPDLVFSDLRGNIATRLAKAEQFDAVVMAAAALNRLGLGARIAEALETEVMVPQVGQGAIAVECRAGDAEMVERLAALDDDATRRAVEAERSFLAVLGGGCTLPVGAFAAAAGEGRRLQMLAVIASLDGAVCLRYRSEGEDPTVLGAAVADRLLHVAGGAALLSSGPELRS